MKIVTEKQGETEHIINNGGTTEIKKQEEIITYAYALNIQNVAALISLYGAP